MNIGRRLMLLMVAALMVVTVAVATAGPVFAVPSGINQGHHTGGGAGGGDTANPDSGNHTSTGGGTFNNPHLGFGT